MSRHRKGIGEPRPGKTLTQAIAQRGQIGLFVAELALRGGRVAEAARAAGLSDSYGRTLLHRYPEIRERTRRFWDERMEAGIAGWTAMHPRSLEVIAELLENPDPHIRLKAAMLVIERNEGRAPQTVDRPDADDEDLEFPLRHRFAYALFVQGEAPSLEAALQYAEEHMDQAEEWWRGVQK